MADIELTEGQIEMIAERAAEKALEKVYLEVGKSVVKKVFWVIGVITLTAMVYLTSKGHIPTVSQ